MAGYTITLLGRNSPRIASLPTLGRYTSFHFLMSVSSGFGPYGANFHGWQIYIYPHGITTAITHVNPQDAAGNDIHLTEPVNGTDFWVHLPTPCPPAVNSWPDGMDLDFIASMNVFFTAIASNTLNTQVATTLPGDVCGASSPGPSSPGPSSPGPSSPGPSSPGPSSPGPSSPGPSSPGPLLVGELSHIRDYDGRRVLALVQGTSLAAFVHGLDDTVASSSSSFTIDGGASSSSGNCSAPRLHLNGHVLEVVYLRGSTPRLARSRTHARTWEIMDIPGNYSNVTSVLLQDRMVLLGYRSLSSSSSSSSSSSASSGATNPSGWYCRVGKLNQSDGTYTWSGEVAVLLPTSANGGGELRNDREDGVLEFVYTDLFNVPHVVSGRRIGLDGTGDWR